MRIRFNRFLLLFVLLTKQEVVFCTYNATYYVLRNADITGVGYRKTYDDVRVTYNTKHSVHLIIVSTNLINEINDV